MTQIKSLDLFSGIGGVSLALTGFCKPILYCDIDKYCQHVLVDRMREKRLERAPIHSDINTLYLSPEVVPNMICGGFPCTDVSSIGLQKGINEDTSSGLFLQIMRLVDENPSIEVIFLENVANILRCGLKDVLRELSLRNFSFCWTMRSAGSLGAPHQRNRWFCLATRNGFDITNFDIKEQYDVPFVTNWDKEPSERVSFKPHIREDASYDDNWSLRCQTLGNTVCPHAVRSAFVELVKIHRNKTSIMDCFGEFSQCVERMEYPYPENGLVHNQKFYALPVFTRNEINSNTQITLKLRDHEKTTKLARFPTPRRGITHPSALTDRSIRDLPTILVNCEESKEYIKSHFGNELPEKIQSIVVPNVRYIEYMMGYPSDWTRSNSYQKSKRSGKCIQDTITMDDQLERDGPKVKLNKSRLNGMHMLMKEHSGLDIKQIASIWRGLSSEEREEYTRRAKQLTT